MAHEILMPRLGWATEEGALIEWLKQDGDPVRGGDVVCVIESDKAQVEVEVFDAGTLRIPAGSPAPGAKVPVGTLLGYRIHETGPVTALQLKGGKKLKIAAKGDELGLTLADDPSPMLLELRLGAERYCLEFGGSTTFSAGKKLQAKSAPAASACPP